MRILFIPLDTFSLKSNELGNNRMRLLSRRNEIVGVERGAAFAKGPESFVALIKFLYYALKVLLFGLKHRKDFDLIFCCDTIVAYSSIGVCISILYRKPCIRDNPAVTRYYHREVKTRRSRYTTLIALIAEKVILRSVRVMLVCSEAGKKAYIDQGFAANKIEVLPLSVDLSLADEVAADKDVLRKRLGLEARKGILIFTGRRGYPPNMEAARWINQELAPAISQKFDDAQILMTASGEVPEPTHSIITFTGYVPNIFEYILASDIFIAPVELLSGVLVKVLDSMSCGKPTVVMAWLANIMHELADGYNVMIARDRDEFIQKTLYLLEHLDEAQEIGIRARKTMEQHYASDIWEERLNEILERCVG